MRAPLDEATIARIRAMRETMTAETVAHELGLNVKTVQKYSKGMNVGKPKTYRTPTKDTDGKGPEPQARIVRPSVQRQYR